MSPPSRGRKSQTLFCAIVLAVIAVWFGAEIVVMSGTKASFSFAQVSSPPIGGTTTTTRTTTARTTTSTTAKTTPAAAAPAAGGTTLRRTAD